MGISIVRQERDGIEFFTVASSGESGMSVSGLAKLCGVSQPAITRLLNRVMRGEVPKGLESLVGVEFQLITKTGKDNRKIIRDDICAEILEYFAFESGNRTEAALFSFRKFARIGIRSWIQGITGWQPPSEVDQFIENHILREARSWEVVFDRQWIKAAEQATGWGWGDPCMRHLINLLVYDRLPVEVRQELDRLNPVGTDGHRAKKQHQFFSVESVEQVLKLQISVSRSLLLVSTSWGELKENSRRHFEGMAQLKLLP